MAAPKAVVYTEDSFSILKVGPMGPYGNNAYLLHDAEAKDALLVDMPLDEAPLLQAIAEIGNVHQIVATHWHRDHWMTYDPVRKATNAPVLVGDKEINILPERIDKRIAHGDDVKVGSKRVTILHTPGHTRLDLPEDRPGAHQRRHTLSGWPRPHLGARRPGHHRELDRHPPAAVGGRRHGHARPWPEHHHRRHPARVRRVREVPLASRLLRRRGVAEAASGALVVR